MPVTIRRFLSLLGCVTLVWMTVLLAQAGFKNAPFWTMLAAIATGAVAIEEED